MKVINCAPDTGGLIRWLRDMHKTDPGNALAIISAGWPELTKAAALDVLTGRLELVPALQAARQANGKQCRRCGSQTPVGQSCGCFDNGGQ